MGRAFQSHHSEAEPTMKKVLVLLFILGSGFPAHATDLSLAAGGTHSLALTSDGRVFEWGARGGLTPVPVFGLENVIAVAAGEQHALALRRDGTVWTWGENGSGQLGDGTRITRDR